LGHLRRTALANSTPAPGGGFERFAAGGFVPVLVRAFSIMPVVAVSGDGVPVRE
jgi:hypothetical protein